MKARGESAAPGALIRTTLRNVRIDRWRRQRRVSGDVPVVAIDHAPLDDVAIAELRGLLRRAVAALPDPQREVVRLRICEHMKFKDIAAMQDVPLNTVLGRMHLALQKLRAAMAAHVGEEPADA
jgi:RNA polymerase sigma factor (sigma-70 family)